MAPRFERPKGRAADGAGSRFAVAEAAVFSSDQSTAPAPPAGRRRALGHRRSLGPAPAANAGARLERVFDCSDDSSRFNSARACWSFRAAALSAVATPSSAKLALGSLELTLPICPIVHTDRIAHNAPCNTRPRRMSVSRRSPRRRQAAPRRLALARWRLRGVAARRRFRQASSVLPTCEIKSDDDQ
jgi:hypothetical protein